ncbi:MAG: aminotransferase class V-fold PLP-dependent enzyme [Pseudomonadota bacterium]
MAIPTSRAQAKEMDRQDPLRMLRDQFDLDDSLIYLDGNSLGAPTKAALSRLRQTAEIEWKRDLIKSWNTAGWIDLPKSCGRKIASVIGVDADDVLICDSVSTNIFKLAGALWSKAPGAIAYCRGEFPTDGYILQGLSRLTGASLDTLADGGPDVINGNVNVIIKSVVDYKSAAVTDISAWEQMASAHGVAIIWDLSHAAGLLDLQLKETGAKYAVGCGYKFLNGGPGAPAYIYADKAAAEQLSQPLSGWMGHAKPFDFADDYAPAEGVDRFACGTPPILSLSVLDAALDVFEGVSMSAVEAKAAGLGDLLLARCAQLGLESIAPGIGEKRGGHISVRHPNGYEIVQALIAKGIIGDFRPPDLMRFGFSPLYIRHTDIWNAADMLEEILTSETWRNPEFAERKAVV